MYAKLNLNLVLWVISVIKRWYTASGVPKRLVHQILCTELIGVNILKVQHIINW